jgi:hypothetical protein
VIPRYFLVAELPLSFPHPQREPDEFRQAMETVAMVVAAASESQSAIKVSYLVAPDHQLATAIARELDEGCR